MTKLFVRKVQDKKNGCIRVQICSNTRIGKKVVQRCVRHIGTARNEVCVIKIFVGKIPSFQSQSLSF